MSTITLPDPQKDNPSDRLVPCEHPDCNRRIQLSESHSFVMVYATTGVNGMAAFQCPAEQHFACCQEHAAALAHACLDQHLIGLHHVKQSLLERQAKRQEETP